MIIEKVDDGKKFPRCLDCDVPLYQEGTELSNAQKYTGRKQNECQHEFPEDELWPVCGKCGFSLHLHNIPSARLMRCPKCAVLYHVEDD
jgi:uncharacterized C2H2 Zn-finger protein